LTVIHVMLDSQSLGAYFFAPHTDHQAMGVPGLWKVLSP